MSARQSFDAAATSEWSLAPNALLFLLLLFFVTAATAGITVWQWRRRGKAIRVISVVLVQLLVVVSVVTYINRTDRLVTTWSSFVGSTGGLGPAVVSQSAGTGSFGGGEPNRWKVTPEERKLDMSTAKKSSVVPKMIRGGLTGYNLEARIYLPGSYDNTKSSTRRFPVIELLAGYPGSYLSWPSGLHLKQTLDDLIARGKMPAVIAVIPSQNPHSPADSECVDADPSVNPDSRSETYLTGDVPAYAAQHYRVASGRINWVLGGYSTGGYCAANLALRHPDLYASVIAMSGYFVGTQDSWTGRLFKNREQLDANSPQLTITKPHPKLAFFTIYAKDNQVDLSCSNKFVHAIPATDAHLAMTTETGGHSPPVWRVGSRYAFIWLAQLLSR